MSELRYVLNLQFFSAEGEGRTEKATDKKRNDSREKGQVAKSKDLDTAVLIVGFCGMMMPLGAYMLTKIKESFSIHFNAIGQLAKYGESKELQLMLREGIKAFLLICLPLWIALMIIAFIVCYIQVKYKFTLKPMKPQLSKMNPLKGIKKIVSKDAIVTLVMSVFKIIILGWIGINVIQDKIPQFLQLYRLEVSLSLTLISETVLELGFFVGGAFLILAILDYAYQRYKHEDSLKMTKQEIKEEYKNAEGDPQIKGKIKQKMRAAAMGRMMQAIPEADVIITNPTHFAVALKYDEESGRPPIVVAKGVDYVAQQIKEKGREHHIEIVENRPLARSLYYTVDIDKEIPPELYGAVAEVLAFVYNMQNKKQRP